MSLTRAARAAKPLKNIGALAPEVSLIFSARRIDEAAPRFAISKRGDFDGPRDMPG